jgi:hypothetical protein
MPKEILCLASLSFGGGMTVRLGGKIKVMSQKEKPSLKDGFQ